MANKKKPETEDLKPQRLQLKCINLDARIREVREEVVEEYVESMQRQCVFPPLTVFRREKDGLLYLADGFHILAALKRRGEKHAPCIIYPGGLHEARLYAAGANQGHGLRRSNADKRQAVMALLTDPLCRMWTNRKIADHVGVSHTMVSNVSKQYEATTSNGSRPTKRLTADGRTMDTTNIGRKKKQPTDSAEADNGDGDDRAADAETEAETDSAGANEPNAAYSATEDTDDAEETTDEPAKRMATPAEPVQVTEPTHRLYYGTHVLDGLRKLPDKSVHTICTSPPYYQQRKYPVGDSTTWTDGWEGQLGLEPTIGQYVKHLVEVFREARRVLRDDGVLWINLGDKYENGDLVGVPWRVVFALRADGWILRRDAIWERPNVTPESAKTRPTGSHEYVFLLTKKSSGYYYDWGAETEPMIEQEKAGVTEETAPDGAILGRNLRSVWSINLQPTQYGHLAPWPEALVERMVLLSTSERGSCPHCGAPWKRITERPPRPTKSWKRGKNGRDGGLTEAEGLDSMDLSHGAHSFWLAENPPITTGWKPTCKCDSNDGSSRSVVLDPFSGSGTTGQVAVRHGRDYIGIDLDAGSLDTAKKRIGQGLNAKDKPTKQTKLSQPMEVQLSSKTCEWYTPAKYVEAVREVLGATVELDPASCTEANDTVKAARYYTVEDDGLAQPWQAKTVFLNPPFGKNGVAGKWVAKAIAEHKAGNAEELIVLVNNCTEAKWFQSLWAYPICFVDHPIRFVPGDGRKTRGAAKRGQVFAYLGPNAERFVKAFSTLGKVVVPGGIGVHLQVGAPEPSNSPGDDEQEAEDALWFEKLNFNRDRPSKGSDLEAKILDAAHDYYRQHGYPLIERSDGKVSEEFNRIRSTQGCLDAEGETITQNMVGLGLANLYQQELMLNTRCRGFRTPLEVVQDGDLLRKALLKRVRYGENLRPNGVRKAIHSYSGTQRVSNFRPSAARSIIEHFRPSLVVDPCAGWGGRMLGAMAACVPYVGIDPHRAAVENNIRLRDRVRECCNGHASAKVELIVDRAEAVLGQGRWKPDLIFTSPPYFDAEKYDEGHPDQSYVRYPELEVWCRDFLGRCLQGSFRDLTDDGFLVLNVNPDMAERTVELAEGVGFRLLAEWRLALSSHQFRKSSGKGTWRYEPVLVFGKKQSVLPERGLTQEQVA